MKALAEEAGKVGRDASHPPPFRVKPVGTLMSQRSCSIGKSRPMVNGYATSER